VAGTGQVGWGGVGEWKGWCEWRRQVDGQVTAGGGMAGRGQGR
jgi:hypothetical protein